MKTYQFFTFFLFLFSFQILPAQQESLIVQDPQRRWAGQHTGTIEEALISLEPQGIYTEVGLYLTISDRNTNFSSGANLEIVLDFNLPEGSIIHDSWLWVGNDIIRAKILDKWGANLIYEDIVDRNQDPSILFKLNRNQFQLRVFPLPVQTSRKLKLSYLVPNDWTSEKVLTTLPINILNLSRFQVPKAELIIWETDDFKTPSISGIDLEPRQDNNFGDYFYSDISNSYQNIGQLQYQAPLNNGVYMNHYLDGDEQFYQLALSPNFLFDKNLPKEVIVMFDNDSDNSNISKSTLLEEVKSKLKANLTEGDHFNLIKSGLFPRTVSDEWLSGDDATIDQAFENLGELNSYSSLPSVISEGVEFITEYGTPNSSFLLVSNSDEITGLQLANEFLNDVQSLVSDTGAPFHVLYYQNRNYQRFWANNQYYYSGTYVYSNLALLTGGEFVRAQNTSQLNSSFEKIMNTMSHPIDFFDFYTTTQSGFCHSRYTNIDGQTNIYPDKAILQVGKYEGDAPFYLRMNGSLNGEIKSKEIIVEASEIRPADTLIREAWVGNWLQDLEDKSSSNEDISEIIRISLDERVLSEYTAFLCLEPSQGGEPCLDCIDENEVLSSTDVEPTGDSLKIELLPNPFSEEVVISVEKPISVKTNEVTCQIFNTVGTLVQNLESKTEGSKVQFKWNGNSFKGRVGAGMYIAVVTAGQFRKSVKIIYQP